MAVPAPSYFVLNSDDSALDLLGKESGLRALCYSFSSWHLNGGGLAASLGARVLGGASLTTNPSAMVCPLVASGWKPVFEAKPTRHNYDLYVLSALIHLL